MRRARVGAAIAVLSVVVSGATTLACGGATFSSSAYDAGVDGASLVDARGPDAADAGPFCSGKTLDAGYDFCADFDVPATLQLWDIVINTGSGTVSVDPTASTSAPNSLFTTTPAVTTLTDSGVAALVHRSSLPAGAGHVELDFRVDALSFPIATDPLATVTFLAVTYGKNNGDYTLGLTLHPSPGVPYALEVIESSTTADAGTVFVAHPLSVVPQPGDWTHLKVDLPGVGGTELDVTLTDRVTSKGSGKQVVTLTPTTGSALEQRALSLGILPTGSVGQAQIRADSVTWTH